MFAKTFVFLLYLLSVVHYRGDVLFASAQDIYRLSNTTRPISYDIDLTVDTDCEAERFQGHVKITVEVLEAIDTITFHRSSHIEDPQIKVLTTVQEDVEGEIVEVEKELELIKDWIEMTEIQTLTLEEPLELGREYRIDIAYSAKISQDKLGLYQSTYEDPSGEKVCLLSTQFAPTQARRVFPCYDEPSFKANYNIRITHPIGTKAISNEQQNSFIHINDQQMTTVFDEVKLMPTYLVGLVISDFEYTQNTSGGLTHQVYSRKEVINKLNFALNFAMGAYDYLAEYFNRRLPLTQLKHVAIPEFYFSAMENWGLITYKESRFLFDPTVHSANLEQSISNVIGHEIAHHWFGDLVTMKWWTHVWLKEGFATLFSYYAQDAARANHDAIQFLLVEKMHYVFNIDSSPDIKPMSKYIEKQEDIMANYDKIAYDKACCVLRMMEHAFSTKVFQTALRQYIQSFEFNNTDEDDLFTAIQNALDGSNQNRDVAAIMGSWTQQSGYPVITVTVEKPLIRLTQERFIHKRFDNDPPEDPVWWIPVTFYVPKTDIIYSYWFNQSQVSLQCADILQSCSSDEVFIVNHEQAGYYRVNYDEDHWILLAKTLAGSGVTNVHVNNRAQLLDDAFNLAYVGRLKYSLVFNLAKYLYKETEYAPWAAFKRGVDTLRQYLSSNSNFGRLSQFVRSVVEQPYKNMALVNQNVRFSRKFSRQIIVSLACEYGVQECLKDERDYSYPDLREVYYCNRLRAGGNSMYSDLRNMLKTETDPVLRAEIISALGCAPEQTQIAVVLLVAIDKTTTYQLTNDERIQLVQSVYRKSRLGVVETLNLFHNEDMKNVFDSLSDLEKLCVDFAKYINSYDLSISFNQQMLKVLTASKAAEVKNAVRQNLWWIADYGGQALNSLPATTNRARGIGGYSWLFASSLFALRRLF